jgi:Ca2+-binding RTX toxin-like protein
MRSGQRLLATMVLVSLVLIPAPPASAKLDKSFANGVFKITGGPAADSIEIICDGANNVALNGMNAFMSCPEVSRIVVDGGGGKDSIDLDGVDPADFTSLTRTTLMGGAGNDVLAGSQGRNTFVGGLGNDVLIGGPNDDKVGGGPGEDMIYLQTDGTLTLTDSSAFSAAVGLDAISGIEAYAVFASGSAPVTVDATSVTHLVWMADGPANDTFYGGLGNDVFLPGLGADNFDGGPGKDRVISHVSNDQQVFDTALVDGSGFVDMLSSVERATLEDDSGDHTLDASSFSGSVELKGGAGSDTLLGGPKADTLIGGPGTDTCTSGPGKDTLKGCEIGS